MTITIAICTWNRSQLLKQTLEAMTALVVPPDLSWEILVVNNNSSDDTAQVVESFVTRLPLRTVVETKAGLSHARNRALDEARGDYLMFTDDDVLVDRHWVTACADAVRRHPDAAAMVGPVAPWFPSPPDPVLADVFPELKRGFCSVALSTEEGPLADADIDAVFGVNMAFKRAAVSGLRFDPNFGVTHVEPGKGGDEAAFFRLVRARGGAILWCPSMRLDHFVDPARMRLPYLLRFSIGRGRMLMRRQGPEGPTVFGVPRWILRQLVQETVTYAVLALTPARRRALQALREQFRLRGMLAECLDMRREAQMGRRYAA